jgi:hypothetical protein
MSKKRYSKVEEEILEILDRAEQQTPKRRYRPVRPKLSSRMRMPTGLLRGVPFGLLWLGGVFGFALAAILVSGWSGTLATLLAIASILVLFSPIVLGFRSTSQQTGPKEWRGRVISLPPPQEGVVGKIRYKIWEIRNRNR